MEWLSNLAWYWWVVIGIAVVVIGALKLKVFKSMINKKKGKIDEE